MIVMRRAMMKTLIRGYDPLYDDYDMEFGYDYDNNCDLDICKMLILVRVMMGLLL